MASDGIDLLFCPLTWKQREKNRFFSFIYKINKKIEEYEPKKPYMSHCLRNPNC